MIPIRISPAFWFFAALIGFILSSGSLLQTVVWVGIIFVSVLFHEFGHALTARAFGLTPRIELVAMGGLTYHNGDKLPFWKQFLITLNGPVFGFLIVIAAEASLRFLPIPPGYFRTIIDQTGWINFIWTIINLLPVMPLDGGQLLRIVMEKIFHAKGLRYTFLIGAIFSLGCSLLFFLGQNLFAGALFFLFAFENFDGFRKSRFLRDTDRSVDFKQQLLQAEQELRAGNKEKALALFEKLRTDTKEGMIYVASTQYAAFLKYEQGKIEEAFQTMLPIRDRLDPEGMFLLHRLAFEQKNYPLVLDLAGAVFQNMPEAEVALRSAYAAAHLGAVEAAIGWLQTSLRSGAQNLKEIVQEAAFDPVRSDPRFNTFIQEL